MNTKIDTERLIAEVRLRPSLWDFSCEQYKDRDAKLQAWFEVCQEIIPKFVDLPNKDKKLAEKQVQQRWKTARDAYVRCKTSMKNTKSGSKGGIIKKYIFFDHMHFLDKNKVVDTEDSIPTSQNTNNESQSNSEQATIKSKEYSLTTPSSNQTGTCDDAPTSSLSCSTFRNPNTSQSNQIAAGSTYQSGRKIVSKRKRTFVEDDQFEREMLNLFKENTKMMQNDDMSFFYSLLPILQTFSTRQKLIFRSEMLQKAIEMSANNENFNENRPGTSHTFTSSELQDADLALYSTLESDNSQDIQEEPSTP